jgi:RHS repeat-associated protein
MVRKLRSIVLSILALVCVSQAAFASSTAVLVVGGAESQRFDQSWDVGPIQMSFNGFAETIYYGQYSSPASVAASIAGQFTRDYLKNGLCAHASGSTVTFILSGSSAIGTLSTTNTNTSFYFSTAGFAGIPIAPPPTTGTVTTQTTTTAMTGGSDAGTFYDSGTVTVQVSGATAQADWNEGATAASVASNLASAINAAAGGFVSASPSGNSIIVTSLTDGPAADMSITGSVADSNPDYFSTPGFSVSTQNMSGGAFSAGSPLYSFVIPDQGGYDLNGNLLSVTDSVMGQWNYAYDNLNRLTQASAPVSQPTGVYNYYAGVQPTWTYDPFGNRLTETQGAISGATPTASMPPNVTTTYTATGNQINTTTLGTGITYDAAGDVTYDGTNDYLYDAEGRLCAVNNDGGLTGYIYDASGIRVAKGSLTSFSCNFSSNGYATTASYVLGPGGEQVTEYNGAGTWQHTNAFVSGTLLASYHDTDTYFALEDWLGTKRAEISAGGLIANYHSLAYGNGLFQTGTAPDATEHHFTGKERDSESGNDYFDARYYSSNLGRFLSPDWSAKVAPIPYAKLDNPQSLNLYSYVLNHPTTSFDLDGHECAKNDGLCQAINSAWNTVHEIVSPTQINSTVRLASFRNGAIQTRVGYNPAPDFAANGKMNPVFTTAQDAANAAAKADGDLTAKDGHEWGESIFQYASGGFSYSAPAQGTKPDGSSNMSAECCNNNDLTNIPPGSTLAGFSHSHTYNVGPDLGDVARLNEIQAVTGKQAVGAVFVPGQGVVPFQSKGAMDAMQMQYAPQQ